MHANTFVCVYEVHLKRTQLLSTEKPNYAHFTNSLQNIPLGISCTFPSGSAAACNTSGRTPPPERHGAPQSLSL